MVAAFTSGTISNDDGYKLVVALKDAMTVQPGPLNLDLAGVIGLARSSIPCLVPYLKKRARGYQKYLEDVQEYSEKATKQKP